MNFFRLAVISSISAVFSSSAVSAVEFTVGHVDPPGEPSNVAFSELAKRLKESNSDISMIVFPQGQIGSEADAVEQVRLGALDITTVANPNLANFAPSAGVFDIPFLFRDSRQHPQAVIESEIGSELTKKIEEESGLTVLGWWSAGQRHLYTRETTVESPEDLNGIKVRVIGSPVYLDTFNELGALATGMPYGEVYSALANGTIDAAEGNTSGYRNMKFWEQAPQLSLTGHFFLFKPVLANTNAIERLSAEQKMEFDEIFKEVTKMQWDLFDSSFSSDIEELQRNGITVTQPDVEAFRLKAKPVAEKHGKIFGEELVSRIRSIE